jgi:hypothetical protein
MNDSTSLSPSRLETKSSSRARDRMLLSDPTGADLSDAPSQNNAIGTCRMSDLLQAARANTIGPLLVLLNLLERKTERIAELPLAHGEHQPPHTHPAADVLVDGIRHLALGHRLPPSSGELPGSCFGLETVGQR